MVNEKTLVEKVKELSLGKKILLGTSGALLIWNIYAGVDLFKYGKEGWNFKEFRRTYNNHIKRKMESAYLGEKIMIGSKHYLTETLTYPGQLIGHHMGANSNR